MSHPSPAALLRLESAAAFLFAVAVYAAWGGSWLLFAALVLAPDLAMLGYLAGTRAGAAAYNAAHTAALPLALVGLGLAADLDLAVSLGLIWLVHIAFDRLLGYGLKYPTAFKDTHLARV